MINSISNILIDLFLPLNSTINQDISLDCIKTIQTFNSFNGQLKKSLTWLHAFSE